MHIKQVFSNFKGDIFGGITAGVIALPLALAFGVASGVGAAAGLYGAILVGLFASLFGGTKPQISGPTGPMTVIVAALAASSNGNFKLIFLAIVLAGLFQIILGFSKVGRLIKYVPYPVISGFMSGIGVIIIILQINPLLGINSEGSPLKTILKFSESIGSIELQSIILGLLTLFIVFFTPSKIKQIIPPALIALISVTLVSVLFGFNVKTIEEIPTMLPSLQLPLVSLDEFIKTVPIAVTLAILGSVDSLLTSLVSDSLTKTHHNSNKELIGQGIGNMVAGLFGGIAGAGATMRTVVNIKSGGKTPLSGIIHSLFLITILLGAAPLASYVPMAVLAGILIKVGFDIIDYKFIKVIKHAPKYDLIVMILVFVLTVFDDLIFAVDSGIVLSSLLFATNISRQFNVTVNDVEDHIEENPDTCLEKISNYKTRIVDIDGVFFFGSASRILTRVDELLGTKYLIINCQTIDSMDISAIFALEDIIVRIKDHGINVLLVINNENIYKKLHKLGIFQIINENSIFYDKNAAIDKVKLLINDKLQSCENHYIENKI